MRSADMEKIAGQKPIIWTLARKSVAGFKIRDGYADRLQSYACVVNACTSSWIVW